MTQIFKNPIPHDILFTFLDETCTKINHFYVFDKNSYKKGIFIGLIDKFLETCRPYYYLSKQKYTDRKVTYNSFTTVIRQICNYNNITYTSEIKYDKSTYSIVYYIEDSCPDNKTSETNVF